MTYVMLEIGEEEETIVVEPLEEPVPREEPAPREPVTVPEEVPVGV